MNALTSAASMAAAASNLSISDSFKSLQTNLAVKNHETIELRYGEITCALNQEFRNTESKTANCLQVGSYGRCTAVNGVSDLDMLFKMPASAWETYKDGGQYKLLSKARDAIKARYPTTTVRVSGLVVQVLYKDFHVEVQPVFEQSDGSFLYPHTANGGSWKTTKPNLEIQAMIKVNTDKNRNLRRLCKMARAWKNKHGVAMGGLLIDTLAHNFLKSTTAYDDKSYAYYDEMVRDFFAFLKDEPEKDYYAALGSGQRVKVKKKFQKKAKKAFELCEAAIAADGQAGAYKQWRKVFGRAYPALAAETALAYKSEGGFSAKDTEEFIEDKFPVDIRYDLRIDCNVTQKGFQPARLLEMLAKRFPLHVSKELNFEIIRNSVPEDHQIYWKVLNRGPEAIR
ncbi:MAG: SMODS domain-containing nucleotidyltransferase, partial [Hyphomicrobiales bacterium]